MHQQAPATLQTHHMCSTLKRRGNDRFHVVPRWIKRGMFIWNIQNLVMEMCSDLFHTGRMVTGNRFYSATDTAEMLYEKELIYWRKMNKNRKGLPAEIKTFKEQENESSACFW